jgi:hypothetical protein
MLYKHYQELMKTTKSQPNTPATGANTIHHQAVIKRTDYDDDDHVVTFDKTEELSKERDSKENTYESNKKLKIALQQDGPINIMRIID